jgi:hypothetical protein
MTDTHTLGDEDRTVDTHESNDAAEVGRPPAVDSVRSAPIVAALERAWDAPGTRSAAGTPTFPGSSWSSRPVLTVHRRDG